MEIISSRWREPNGLIYCNLFVSDNRTASLELLKRAVLNHDFSCIIIEINQTVEFVAKFSNQTILFKLINELFLL